MPALHRSVIARTSTTAILALAGSALALPPLTGHSDNNLSVTWSSVAFPAFNGQTDMHQHWKNQPLPGVNAKFKTYAAWDDSNWRYNEAMDRPYSKGLDGFDYGHGFMQNAAAFGWNTPDPIQEPGGTPGRRPAPAGSTGLLGNVVNQWMGTVNQVGMLNSNNVATVTQINFFNAGVGIGGPAPGAQIEVRFADTYQTGPLGGGGGSLPFPDYPDIYPDGTWPGNPEGANTSDGVLAFWTPSLRTLTFNAKAPWYIGNSNDPTVAPQAFDFWSVALHEFGHILGLKHPDNAINLTTMYPSIGNRGTMTMAQINTSRTIDADTLDGARGLYTIPAPGTLGLLGISGLLAIRRRRS